MFSPNDDPSAMLAAQRLTATKYYAASNDPKDDVTQLPTYLPSDFLGKEKVSLTINNPFAHSQGGLLDNQMNRAYFENRGKITLHREKTDK